MEQKYLPYIIPGNESVDILLFGDCHLLLQKVDDGVLLHEFGADERLVQEKILREIASEEIPSLRCIDSIEGTDFSFCLFLGWKHRPFFLDEVVGYRREPKRHWLTRVRFDFYGKRG